MDTFSTIAVNSTVRLGCPWFWWINLSPLTPVEFWRGFREYENNLCYSQCVFMEHWMQRNKKFELEILFSWPLTTACTTTKYSPHHFVKCSPEKVEVVCGCQQLFGRMHERTSSAYAFGWSNGWRSIKCIHIKSFESVANNGGKQLSLP